MALVAGGSGFPRSHQCEALPRTGDREVRQQACFVLAFTGEVNGDPAVYPQDEAHRADPAGARRDGAGAQRVGRSTLPQMPQERRSRRRSSEPRNTPEWTVIMKGPARSGGADTRLRAINHTSAKHLVPAANKPVRFSWLGANAVAWVTETGIVVDNTAPEIRAAVGDGSRSGLGSGTMIAELPRMAIVGMPPIEVSPIVRSVEVIPASRTPAMHRQMLGDHGKAQIPS